jgi:hypothetical protein
MGTLLRDVATQVPKENATDALNLVVNKVAPVQTQKDSYVVAVPTDVMHSLHHIDEIVLDSSVGKQKTQDAICCVCAAEKIFLIVGCLLNAMHTHAIQGHESGIVRQYSLPSGVLATKFSLGVRLDRMEFNSTARWSGRMGYMS